MKGYLHVYTGNGKGKTTAAMGLALRAVGAGMKVFIGQFVKGMKYSEVAAFENFSDSVVIRQYGRDCFIEKDPEPEDVRLAKKGLDEVAGVLASGEYDVVILDEITIANYFNLFTVDDVLKVLEGRATNTEVVLTGRYADERLVDVADLVTDMTEVKHYYTLGVLARRGIDS